ncbi:hypothetical protein CROQUDRAFT_722234 [Cronartium quercuum f. sp. fusiforme G11]|uniref:Uncharacterized protein n=1 Tax=Cronartium quercuum f. sp. fusiforme G11 TaxID=708437 RepID=A0A9P6TCP8_9BASI|nr:hypothetical protein CROQUDRAFT_722234 [Cronartium quercuum f. sp. fusiforme G11]
MFKITSSTLLLFASLQFLSAAPAPSSDISGTFSFAKQVGHVDAKSTIPDTGTVKLHKRGARIAERVIQALRDPSEARAAAKVAIGAIMGARTGGTLGKSLEEKLLTIKKVENAEKEVLDKAKMNPLKTEGALSQLRTETSSGPSFNDKVGNVGPVVTGKNNLKTFEPPQSLGLKDVSGLKAESQNNPHLVISA